MDKLWVFLLVSSPFLGFFTWLAWWLISDSLRERRRSQAATHNSAVNCCKSPA